MSESRPTTTPELSFLGLGVALIAVLAHCCPLMAATGSLQLWLGGTLSAVALVSSVVGLGVRRASGEPGGLLWAALGLSLISATLDVLLWTALSGAS